MDRHRGEATAPSRAVRGPARLLRGWAGAFAMTGLAALLHSAAAPAHAAPPLGVVLFAAVLAAPITTALAGRALSLWRTAMAVAAAQTLFHALYAVVGAGHAVTVAPGVDPAHLGHLHAGAAGPSLTVTASLGHGAAHVDAGAGMLASHVLAAAVTTLVLRWGEGFVTAVAERVLRAAPILAGAAFVPLTGPRRVLPTTLAPRRPALALAVLGATGRRGPPSWALAA